MKSCFNCRFATGSMCRRPMRMNDGEERLFPRPTFYERKLKHPEWKRLKRPQGDICGESAKHWVA